jgi:hypothetical protein
MRTVTARQARALRAASASALTTLFAAAAHTLGGGGAPAPTVLLIAVLLSLPVALGLTGRRAGRIRTGMAVVGSQAVYHLVFAVFGMSAVLAGPVAHVHGALAAAAVPPVVPGMTATDPMMGLFEPSMLAMHVIAAAATVLVLRHGERLLQAVVAMIWPALLRRVFRPLAKRSSPALVTRRAAPALHTPLSGVRSRAPPLAL